MNGMERKDVRAGAYGRHHPEARSAQGAFGIFEDLKRTTAAKVRAQFIGRRAMDGRRKSPARQEQNR
jgi:hypothetical protein